MFLSFHLASEVTTLDSLSPKVAVLAIGGRGRGAKRRALLLRLRCTLILGSPVTVTERKCSADPKICGSPTACCSPCLSF